LTAGLPQSTDGLPQSTAGSPQSTADVPHYTVEKTECIKQPHIQYFRSAKASAGGCQIPESLTGKDFPPNPITAYDFSF